jgi:hypothetical protein
MNAVGTESEKKLNGDERCPKKSALRKIWNGRASPERKNVANTNSCKNITTKVPFTR